MKRIHEISELKGHLRELQSRGIRIGFVPTMGALHEGHLSRVYEAKKHAELVVASIFLNPLQFAPGEDLDRYPRDLEGDLAKLRAAGVGVVFTPALKTMFPEGFETDVEVKKTTQGLCGAHRPGHFLGVTTVVLKLFNIVRPDVAVFGEKDFQQLAVIKAMVRDLSLDVGVVGSPTVREPDGLALSSRNAFLSAKQRAQASSISRGLHRAKDLYDAGERSGLALLQVVRTEMSAVGLVPEYLELRRVQDLAPMAVADDPGVILTAVPVGSTRLIDNLMLRRS